MAKNKKAFHDYEILEKYEAGIVLLGDEVKSIRSGLLNLKGSYVDVENEEAFVNNIHISRYKKSSLKELDSIRKRKLLLHKNQILVLLRNLEQKGTTVVPLEIYLKGGLIKIQVGICRGKKLYDKRETIRKREQDLEINRELKKFKNLL